MVFKVITFQPYDNKPERFTSLVDDEKSFSK